MKVAIDMDEALVAAIDQATKIQNISRDSAFNEALKTWVAHQPMTDRCTIDFSKLEFDPDFIPFETYRPGPEAMPEFHFPKE
jgi:5'(3')-deoxyribonucleotidase